MHLGWRLERTFLAGAGLAESRLEALDLTWSEPLDPTAHAALWADNGTGKTMITALRYSLYLPDSRDFIRGDSDRSLAKLVRSRDVCHVVEQASRIVDGEVQRVVLGMVAGWPGGGTQDLENPSRLHRVFYGWFTGEHGPTIDDLPFRTDIGRWATQAQFVDGVRAVLPPGGAAPPHPPSDHQRNWRRWLDAVGVDLDQVRFQAVMNAAEGGVDRVMRFTDSDAFVQWLIGATMPTSTVEQITDSIDTLRQNAAKRPLWEEELNLWQKLVEPLLDLAVAHEQVGEAKRAAAAARLQAISAVAHADATAAAVRERGRTAQLRYDHHDQARKDAGSAARRAQGHRLRMELRAAELRVREAENIAEQRREDHRNAVGELDAWRIVADVVLAKSLSGRLAGLEERQEAAEKATDELQRQERRLRHDLARLLTHRRDDAESARRAADGTLQTARRELAGADREERDCQRKRGAAAEQVRQHERNRTTAETTLADAIDAELLREGDDPARRDAALAEEIAVARTEGEAAEGELDRIRTETGAAKDTLAAAQRRGREARDEGLRFGDTVAAVDRRVTQLLADEQLLDAVGSSEVDLWGGRSFLTDTLNTRSVRADQNADAARTLLQRARRTIDSIGADGLLPPAETVERAVRRCEDREIPAWSGWRWIADTMNAEVAASFARARPDIASGVVVAEPRLVADVLDVLEDLELDTALWVGAVTDPAAAATGEGDGGTEARILLPPAGAFDREAAAGVVAAARDVADRADGDLADATTRGQAIRATLASCRRFWDDFPEDPRAELNRSREAARQREGEADRNAEAVQARLGSLGEQEKGQLARAKRAREAIDAAAELRRLLVPVIAAASTIEAIRGELPGLRETIASLDERLEELAGVKEELTERIDDAKTRLAEQIRARDDAGEALRTAGLAPTTDGPVTTEEESGLRARLNSVREAMTEAALDPELHKEIDRVRAELAEAGARIGADPDRRALAEEYALSDGARHSVALTESIRTAETRSVDAGQALAKAEAAAESARAVHRTHIEDRADRTSADFDGFPATVLVTSPQEADRQARLLDDLAVEYLEKRAAEERLVAEAKGEVERAEVASQLIDVSARPLRHLAADDATGRVFDDVDELTGQLAKAAEELRQAEEAVNDKAAAAGDLVGKVRALANGKDARAVEDGKDPRLADLIVRLRADRNLAVDAERVAGQLEQRVATLRDDLDQHDDRVRTCARMLHIQASTAIEKLRHYQNQSRLPDGLGEWSGQRFAVIEHEPVPADESVSVDRVARVVHALLVPGAGRSDAQVMLFAAARALVDAPFRVRLLKPHTDLVLDRVDVAELKNFSGGQRVTAGVLLYATMARVKAAGNDASIGWLWLDNPFGQASADQFVRTMRLAADKLGLQLVFTAAPKDKGALSMFDRIITLGRRSRPSSGEKVVVVDDGDRELADLTLIQHDVLQVLGE
ncbi:hypothetical protein [Amycolatopsis sp. SID8362]|uniref:hypothetical protein n=1 Tax=Amycolatopsis sp. SID8362 TaxID=2690346 RepID=UPI00136D96A1|nr:hypothetical protein [Amycolatopsis sp. SID8362]NBH06798.1 hypothetical protein [Amycolatopsis sp. SID8362]NED43495.1 hypothetical protein [Amycolatopsis sp. SID8362]